jgi:hypothetical protein
MEALDRVHRGERYDIILMDVMMPGMSGLEAARRLLQTDPELVIIGQTARATDEDLLDCIEAGMVDRIAKPLRIEEVVAKIRAHVRTTDMH